MPILYLFTIQNLNCYVIDRNFAIISKNTQEKLEELNEGDTTNIFNESILAKDIIKYKLAFPFLSENFDNIIFNYKKNSNIYVEKENNNFWCIIDNEKYFIGNYLFDESYIIFNYICIYDT
jgi:hypothetical protein